MNLDHDDEMPSDEDFNKIREKAEQIYDLAQKIGLYLKQFDIIPVPTPFGTKLGVAAQFSLGKVAFAKRIQDPEAEQFNKLFNDMVANEFNDQFLSQRAQMEKNIAEGRNPLDDGD